MSCSACVGPTATHGSGEGVAAVGERDERARPGRVGCAAGRRPRCRRPRPGGRDRPRRRPTGGSSTIELCGSGRLIARGPIGPSRQRASRSRNSIATSWRTRTCRRSPASMRVEPRGGIACSPRMITLSSASRGRPSSRTRRPATASPAATGNSAISAPIRRAVVGSVNGVGMRRLVRRDPEPRREPLERRALQQRGDQHGEEHDVEELPRPVDALDDGEGREDDRHRAAQARPPERDALVEREAHPDRAREGRDRPGDEHEDEREDDPLEPHAAEVRREHEQAQDEEHPELRDPREPVVEGRDRPPGRAWPSCR